MWTKLFSAIDPSGLPLVVRVIGFVATFAAMNALILGIAELLV